MFTLTGLQNNTVLMTEHTSASAKICHEHMMNASAAELADIQVSGYFMACLGPQDNVAQVRNIGCCYNNLANFGSSGALPGH